MPLTLSHALGESGDPPLRQLSAQVADLLFELNAPPRLAAHLRTVYVAAAQLTAWIAGRNPSLAVDRRAVLFGAAERASQQLRLAAGINPSLARFAATHASWRTGAVELNPERSRMQIRWRKGFHMSA
ncbi:hypothetical protein ACFQ0D_03785 [Micromonospora zhanjiangensis]